MARRIISNMCVSLCVVMAVGLYVMKTKQQVLELALQTIEGRIDHVAMKLENNEKVIVQTGAVDVQLPGSIHNEVAHTAWRDLQESLKDAVVQIFSQIAEIDLLQPQKSPNQYQATGSGFFINDVGEIITNAHVVNQAKALWVQLPSLGKAQLDAYVVGVSPDRDMALLRLTPESLAQIQRELGKIPHLALGNSDKVHRADELLALGYPLGQEGLKSTKGVVSGREKHLIQIDAAINPGNSGGPSINNRGEVIGINTMYAPKAQSVGYIIPINELKVILTDLREVKLLRRPFLGILFNNASESLTKFLGNPQPGGLFVVDVYSGSPLHKVGVQRRDMIYEINGHKVDIYGELSWVEDKISIVDYVSQLKLGESVRIVLYRQGERKEITFNFEQADPLPIHKIYPGYEELDYEIIAGMLVQPLTLNHLALLVTASPGLAKYAEMKQQMEPALVITHIFPDSQAQRSRSFGPGVIIKEMNGSPVKTLDDMRKQLMVSNQTNQLSVETSDGVFDVFPFDKLLKEEKRSAINWGYQTTKVVHNLVDQYCQKELKAFQGQQLAQNNTVEPQQIQA